MNLSLLKSVARLRREGRAACGVGGCFPRERERVVVWDLRRWRRERRSGERVEVGKGRGEREEGGGGERS